MAALLDIFDLDDIFFIRHSGFINDHNYQKILYVLKQRETKNSRVVFQEGCEEEQSIEDQWNEPDEADCKDVAEENKVEENLNCDDLINIFVCADDTNSNKEKVTKFEEELKFLEAWLETPCLYEINTEVAVMNREDIIAGVQMVDTGNSEKENCPIQPAIILKRARIRIQVFFHRGRNEVKIQHYLMEKKVKMKSHPQMKRYGLSNKKTKMKTYVTKLF